MNINSPLDTSKIKWYGFSKDNKPDGKYLFYEIWEDKHPDKVVAYKKIENYDENMLSKEEIEKIIYFGKKIATKNNVKNPIFTMQCDIGDGAKFLYGYTDGKKETPPNAKTYTKKPVFDKNITPLFFTENEGKSIIYHSPLDSLTLFEEITNFKKLITKFFDGKYFELLGKYSDKHPGWEFVSGLVIDNKKLRSIK